MKQPALLLIPHAVSKVADVRRAQVPKDSVSEFPFLPEQWRLFEEARGSPDPSEDWMRHRIAVLVHTTYAAVECSFACTRSFDPGAKIHGRPSNVAETRNALYSETCLIGPPSVTAKSGPITQVVRLLVHPLHIIANQHSCTLRLIGRFENEDSCLMNVRL